jgi:hypothetical protein
MKIEKKTDASAALLMLAGRRTVGMGTGAWLGIRLNQSQILNFQFSILNSPLFATQFHS